MSNPPPSFMCPLAHQLWHMLVNCSSGPKGWPAYATAHPGAWNRPFGLRGAGVLLLLEATILVERTHAVRRLREEPRITSLRPPVPRLSAARRCPARPAAQVAGSAVAPTPESPTRPARLSLSSSRRRPSPVTWCPGPWSASQL